jgi:hypothetical protein
MHTTGAIPQPVFGGHATADSVPRFSMRILGKWQSNSRTQARQAHMAVFSRGHRKLICDLRIMIGRDSASVLKTPQ